MKFVTGIGIFVTTKILNCCTSKFHATNEYFVVANVRFARAKCCCFSPLAATANKSGQHITYFPCCLSQS